MLVFNIDFDKNNLPMKKIIEFAETEAVTGNIMKEYIVTLLLKDNNVLSQICEGAGNVGGSLKSAALDDIKGLWDDLNGDTLAGYIPSIKRTMPFYEYQRSIEAAASSDTPELLLDRLISHYAAFGGGEDSKYVAFEWRNGLNGIAAPDDITMEQLFCLDNQKKILIDNTVSFLKGLPANNALLFGDSGSGKSSMIKALLGKYYKDGLRLIEISKSGLSELPCLINEIKRKKFRYIIFIDDLSFEGGDVEYKSLKVLIDGRIEKQPENILFYATSNRRHLVNETWSERQGDEVHVNDTKNEKLSLSERFGISIYFSSPNQNEYLKIIEGILNGHNIAITDEIKAQAIKWELNYNGRSGRTAVQFVNMLMSSLNAE